MDLQEFSSSSDEKLDGIRHATAFDIIMLMPTDSLLDLATTLISHTIKKFPIEKQHALVNAPIEELYDLFYNFLSEETSEAKENLIGSIATPVSS